MDNPIINARYLNMPQQVQKNKDDIKYLLDNLKDVYSTTTELNEQSIAITIGETNIPQGVSSGFLIDPNGLLFSITGNNEGTITIKYYANLKGQQGLRGDTGEQGAQGIQGKRGYGFYTTQQQILSTEVTSIEYGDIIGYDNPQVGDFVISENEQSNGYYGRITSLATLTTTIEYIGTLKGDKGINYTGAWVNGGEYYIDDVVTYNGNAYICISNINTSTSAPNLDTAHWDIFTKASDFKPTEFSLNGSYGSSTFKTTQLNINNENTTFNECTYGSLTFTNNISLFQNKMFILSFNYNISNINFNAFANGMLKYNEYNSNNVILPITFINSDDSSIIKTGFISFMLDSSGFLTLRKIYINGTYVAGSTLSNMYLKIY